MPLSTWARYPAIVNGNISSELIQNTHYSPHQAGRERTRNNGLEPEVNNIIATFRRHGGEAPDHDTERTEIGEAAHRVKHDETRAAIERIGRKFRQFNISDEFIENCLDAHQAAGGNGLIPWNAHEPT